MRRSATQGVFRGLPLAGALALSAYLLAACLASPRVSWLGWLALIPLFRVIQTLRPAAATVCAGGWGLLFYLTSAHQLQIGVAPGLRSACFLVLIPAAYAYLGARLTRRVGFSPFVLGVGWMLVEFALRPLALSRGLLAGTLGDGLLLHTVGRLFGYVLVAFLVAFASASLLAIFCAVRIDALRQSPSKSLDHAEPVLWHVVRRFRWSPVLIRSQPRAPPFLTSLAVAVYT